MLESPAPSALRSLPVVKETTMYWKICEQSWQLRQKRTNLSERTQLEVLLFFSFNTTMGQRKNENLYNIDCPDVYSLAYLH